MTDRNATAHDVDVDVTPPSGCPFHHGGAADAVPLPEDGTPLRPSPSLAHWRSEAPLTPLDFADGHRGLIATGYDAARAVLEDPRFSMSPARVPLSSSTHNLVAAGEHSEDPAPETRPDAAAIRSNRAGLLGIDGEEHARLRRAITSRFSMRQSRMRAGFVAESVSARLATFRSEGPPNDVWRRFAQPIAATVHCQVLGVPENDVDRWVSLFVDAATTQQRYDYIRELFTLRERDPGEDVVSDLIASESVTREEAEGLVHMLMLSGRDSVAYLITTATTALLTHPDQLARLRSEPERIAPAIEEFMRVGAMFLTLFPRTALEDVEIDGHLVPAGTTVSPSSVAANRDPARWDRPDVFDVDRDAFGHVGFGHGIHGCIGQQLARVEIREAVTALITGLPGLRLVYAEQREPLPFANPIATYEAGEVIVEWD